MPDRLFVALWPDIAARAALRETLLPAQAALPRLRWQPEERWHITLAFLGAADSERAQAKVDQAVLPHAEPIRLRGAGRFGPSVWIGVEHGAWLADLAGLLQRRLHAPDRRFTAHLTVGRARGDGASARAREARDALADHVGPPWLPGEVTLVGSQIGPSPKYTVIARWQLGHDAEAQHLGADLDPEELT